jgi:hypothetical protein
MNKSDLAVLCVQLNVSEQYINSAELVMNKARVHRSFFFVGYLVTLSPL